MEVMIKPVHNMDFDFNTSRFSQQISFTTPSTPKRFGEYYSTAPTTPTHFSSADGHRDFDSGPDGSRDGSASDQEDDGFAFVARSDSESASLTADELFDGGRIKTLKPAKLTTTLKKQKTPTSHMGENKEAYRRIEEQKIKSSSFSSSKGQKKWRSLKDLFLFRSASEGRAADKDPLKKYREAFCQSSSFKGMDRLGSGSGSSRRGPVSAHEKHYTVNRAVSEDMKKKTFLPYKQGILGRLAFNPTAHALANGFGLSRN